jgi:hypothetical protein
MPTRIDDGKQNELIVVTDVSRFSQVERSEIQERIATICCDTQLVPEYRTEYESDATCFRTYVFSTRQPERLYSKLCEHLLESRQFRTRMWDSTWARWTGEDVFLDAIWVHRTYTYSTAQRDGLKHRVQCASCLRFFWVGHALEDGGCPYCTPRVKIHTEPFEGAALRQLNDLSGTAQFIFSSGAEIHLFDYWDVCKQKYGLTPSVACDEHPALGHAVVDVASYGFPEGFFLWFDNRIKLSVRWNRRQPRSYHILPQDISR